MGLPEIIKSKLTELDSLIDKYPNSIPVSAVAKFMGMDDDVLRTTIIRGTCPFGVGGKQLGASRMGCKIPTVTFFLWYTNTHAGTEELR